MKYSLIIWSVIACSSVFFCFSSDLLAADPSSFQEGVNNLGGVSNGQLPNTGAKDIVTKIIEWLLSLVAILAVGVLIVGGIMYITSAGDANKAQKAKSLILYVIAGLLIIGVSAVVVNLVISTFM